MVVNKILLVLMVLLLLVVVLLILLVLMVLVLPSPAQQGKRGGRAQQRFAMPGSAFDDFSVLF